ncbi:phage head-tail connector protein [Listeria monocytogenes]|nr:phage head-tail connector protein [Listeria monocytogenes]EEP7714399.1 phage head-tail connector protein [Listeria monocytogenes]
MTTTEQVLKLINGNQEEQISIIKELTEKRLKTMLREDTIPPQLDYIVTDVTLKRYNRIGNEGMSSYSQEGLSFSFPDSDFKEYVDEIKVYLEMSGNSSVKKGKVRFG